MGADANLQPVKKLAGKTQADGAETVAMNVAAGEDQRFVDHQLQLTCYNSGGAVAAPAAGTLKIEFRGPQADEFEEVSGSPVDMTDRAKWMMLIDANAQEWRFTPASFDGTATYDLVITSRFGAGASA